MVMAAVGSGASLVSSRKGTKRERERERDVTSSKHRHHARVMELYLEVVTATVKSFVNKKTLYI